METRHAKIFEYQDQWREDRPTLNLSKLVRQRLTPLIPDQKIPDEHDTTGCQTPPEPILGYGGGAGYCDYDTTRVHLSLEPWQKQWMKQEPRFSFSVFVQGQLDREIPNQQIPTERRQSLQTIGVLQPPDAAEVEQPAHANSTTDP